MTVECLDYTELTLLESYKQVTKFNGFEMKVSSRWSLTLFVTQCKLLVLVVRRLLLLYHMLITYHVHNMIPVWVKICRLIICTLVGEHTKRENSLICLCYVCITSFSPNSLRSLKTSLIATFIVIHHSSWLVRNILTVLSMQWFILITNQ